MRLDLETCHAETDFAAGRDFDDSNLPTDWSQKLEAGIRAARDGKRSEARLLLLEVAADQPNNEEVWLRLASISEYPEELLVFLNNVLRVNPANERAANWARETESVLAGNFVARGVQSFEAGQADFARQCFRQAIALADDTEAAWLGLARTAEYEEERNGFLEKVLTVNPENETALNQLAASKKQLIERLLAKASAEAFAGDYVAAEDSLAEIFSHTTENADAWLVKAFLAASFDEKIECWQTVLEFDSENELARASTAYMRSLKARLISPLEKEVQEKLDAPAAVEDEFFSFEAEEIKAETATETVFDSTELYAAYCLPEPEDSDCLAMSADEIAVSFDDACDAAELPDYYEIGEEDSSINLDAAAEDLGTDYSFSDEETAEPQQEVFVENEEPEEVNFLANAETENRQSIEAEDATLKNSCPFCSRENEPKTFVCPSCMAVLTVSDLEMLLAHGDANREIVRQAVERMEAEKDSADLSADELKILGIGRINLKDFRKGFSYLREAVRLNPNDVVLSAQTNALAIRLAEIEAQESIHSSMPKNKTILVVDDSATVRKLISGKLEKSGHEVLCAVDGVDAMEKIGANVPDLILLDITMPRMDGYTVCKMIRTNEKTKDVPVVMISGKDGFFDKVRGRMAGTTGYITKPFGPETLMKTVESYIV